MFSGIIAYRGRVAENQGNGDGTTLRVACEGVEQEQPAAKDSIAISGVCLTATRIEGDVVAFDVVPETLARSTLRYLEPGDVVNVEYALRIGDRIGGHLVYGHVDASAHILSVAGEGQGKRMRIERPVALAWALVEKAFVAVDGASLTVAAAGPDWFEIALIPETLGRTTLGLRGAGDRVNVEIDPVARYARRNSD